MADYFADAYFGSKYWTADYFQGGEVDPNAMQAALSGSATITANLTAETVTEAETYGSGPFRRIKQTYRLDDEQERDELRKEIVKIGTAPKEVITGIVQPPTRTTRRQPKIDTLARLSAERLKAEAANRERIKRIIAQDDEWLMMA